MTGSILVIEDSETKLASVVAALKSMVPNYMVETAKSVRSAVAALENKSFSLIIADMSLPTFDVESRERGGTPRPFGGIEVFDYLMREGLTTPVLVVSSYPALVEGSKSTPLEKLASDLARDYPETYRGYVYFDSAYSNWERQLMTHLERLSNEIL
ncbi:response regulator [Polaromonas sp.]|uniref:response regulator n=1 Tax=Polaromonas sp. TaxID=1869339 RepID=UPI0035688796